jgi:hypothetical protein
MHSPALKRSLLRGRHAAVAAVAAVKLALSTKPEQMHKVVQPPRQVSVPPGHRPARTAQGKWINADRTTRAGRQAQAGQAPCRARLTALKTW